MLPALQRISWLVHRLSASGQRDTGLRRRFQRHARPASLCCIKLAACHKALHVCVLTSCVSCVRSWSVYSVSCMKLLRSKWRNENCIVAWMAFIRCACSLVTTKHTCMVCMLNEMQLDIEREEDATNMVFTKFPLSWRLHDEIMDFL